MLGVFFNCSLLYLLKRGLSYQFFRLAGQESPRILPSLPPQYWNNSALPNLAFYVSTGVPNRASC